MNLYFFFWTLVCKYSQPVSHGIELWGEYSQFRKWSTSLTIKKSISIPERYLIEIYLNNSCLNCFTHFKNELNQKDTFAVPPPSQIACTAYLPPIRSSVFTNVHISFVPVAPSGWPSASIKYKTWFHWAINRYGNDYIFNWNVIVVKQLTIAPPFMFNLSKSAPNAFAHANLNFK